MTTTAIKKPQFKELTFKSRSAFNAWLKNTTSKTITFQDFGQDMQRMHIHKSGEILHCDFHGNLYNGLFVNLEVLKVGEMLQTFSVEEGIIKWTRLVIAKINETK